MLVAVAEADGAQTVDEASIESKMSLSEAHDLRVEVVDELLHLGRTASTASRRRRHREERSTARARAVDHLAD